MLSLYWAVYLFDIVAGGGGRLFEITESFSLRYLLFFTGILILLVSVLSLKVRIYKKELLILLLGTSFIPIGLISGSLHEVKDILFDLQQLMFFFIMALIFFQNDNNAKMIVERFNKYIFYIPIVMGIVYVILFSLINIGVLPFNLFYNWASSTNEFFFRGEDGYFFYKGFFFLGIGSIYCFINKRYLIFFFLLFCILLSQTRGIVLVTLAVCALYYILNAKKNSLLIIYMSIPLVILGMLYAFLKVIGIREDVSDSDVVRLNDAMYIFENLKPITALIGNGWGEDIGDRAKIEVVFLEIFYKTGVLGLLSSFSFLIYFLLQKGFFRNPYFYFVVFAYIVSFSNPFVFTPMGITVLAVAIISCRFYK
ncbi:hypothetical protein [Acinetobacter pittii]|uniref:hypothetical protein n=1 Tax=Acinetobacter pittii TaxID=48296 RepID=UPI0005EB5C61|nr:hypothetical protein [Acinetobacter pittii]